MILLFRSRKEKMNNIIRRNLAIFALILLLLTIFSVAWHNITPSHAVESSCDELNCALCVFGNMISKAILPITIVVAAAICLKSATKEATTVVIHTSARSFPMLC